jgi:hypothetical protein
VLASPSLLIEHCDGSNWRVGAIADAQRETDKGRALADQLIEISQVLVVGDAVLPAHHVAGVDAACRVVRVGGVYPEDLDPLLDDPGAARLVEPRVLAEIFGLALITVIRARIEKQRVALVYRHAGPINRLVKDGVVAIGLGFLV